MSKSDRLDVYLVAGGKYHNIDYARLELLKLMAEQPRLKVEVGSDYSDIDAICSADFIVTYTCDGEFHPHLRIYPAADHEPGATEELKHWTGEVLGEVALTADAVARSDTGLPRARDEEAAMCEDRRAVAPATVAEPTRHRLAERLPLRNQGAFVELGLTQVHEYFGSVS